MLVYIPHDIAEAGKKYLTDRGYELKIGTTCDPEVMKREIADADAIIMRIEALPGDVIRCGKKLKVISKHGVGCDKIDTKTAMELGIPVTNGPYSNAESVAEHIVCFVLGCALNVCRMDRAAREGSWSMRDTLRSSEIAGKTAGIIGLGKIGRSAAKKLHFGFDMNILAWSRHIADYDVPDYVQKAESLPELLQSSDFVILCCPAEEWNRHLINAETLALMKTSASFINCSRGSLVDEKALYDALKNGIIAGAAIDCYEKEPVEMDNPLLTLSNIILSPHCSANTKESLDKMAVDAARGVDEVLSGKEITWRVV